LVEPAAPTDEDSHRLASGAGDVLEGLRRFSSLPLATGDFEAVVATSSLRGRGKHRAIRLGELPGFLQELGQSRVALVFGPEKSGLTEEECPTRPFFSGCRPSRISHAERLHAVAVALSASRLAGQDAATGGETWATPGDVEGAIEHWDRALDAIGFYDTDTTTAPCATGGGSSRAAPGGTGRQDPARRRGRILVSLRPGRPRLAPTED
jgi:tRNA C32,U32 (ribose-2'-O)-methylase TrmJ